jgi:LysM repeat protein
MTKQTWKRRILGLAGLIALCGFSALALSACLPLQVGIERPTTAGTEATRVARLSPTGTRATPTPSATNTLGPTASDGRTVTPTATASGTTASLATDVPTSTDPPPATSTARPVATTVECALTHTVQPGERLSQIGALYGVRWQDIAELNGLANPGLIYAGQVIPAWMLHPGSSRRHRRSAPPPPPSILRPPRSASNVVRCCGWLRSIATSSSSTAPRPAPAS